MREAMWAALGSVVFALCFSWPIVRHISHGDIPGFGFWTNDWDLFTQSHWVSFYTISHFREFPLWNPYKCGGMPLFGSPVAAVLTPFVLLDLLFGPVIGLRLAVIAHIAIAFGGAYFLARLLGISKLGAIACAATFAGSSWYYLRAEIGHLNFLPGAYTPWPIALLYLGVERRRLTPAALGGLVMALMLMEAGVHVLLFAVVMLALLAPMIALQRRSLMPLLALAIMSLFTVGFAAVKLLPGLAFTGVYARLWDTAEFTDPRVLLPALFSRDQSPMRDLAWGHFGFYDYGAYIGVWFAGLALLGSVLRFRRALPWTILSIAVLALALGNFGEFSPWALIHRVPFYASQREPHRWLISFTLVTGVLAGFGADAIQGRAKPWGEIVTALLIALALIDGWSVNEPHVHHVVEGEEAPLPWAPRFRQADDPAYGLRTFMASKANIGVVSCYEPIAPEPKARGYNQPGYRGEQYLLGAGTVKLTRWTPNLLTFDIEASRPTRMVVNQNYDPGWRVVEGQGAVVPEGGLIAVIVPEGRQQVVLAYRSKAFVIGLSITLVTFAALLLLWGYERRGERSHSSLV